VVRTFSGTNGKRFEVFNTQMGSLTAKESSGWALMQKSLEGVQSGGSMADETMERVRVCGENVSLH
jgi:hypothetical protein